MLRAIDGTRKWYFLPADEACRRAKQTQDAPTARLFPLSEHTNHQLH